MNELLCDKVEPTLTIQIPGGDVVTTKSLSITPGASTTISFTWDAKDTQGEWVADGTYTAVLRAVDEAGNPSTDLNMPDLIVDRHAPEIESISIDPALFTPDDGPHQQGDGHNDTATITYELKASGLTSCQVMNSLRDALTTIDGGNHQSGSITWNGKVNGQYVDDGIYILRFNILDEAGNLNFHELTVIKNQVPASIHYPQNGELVGKTVIISGSAMDPGLDNPQNFDYYQLWYRAGKNIDFELPENNPESLSLDIWQPIPVPISYQNPEDSQYPSGNTSKRSVNNPRI